MKKKVKKRSRTRSVLLTIAAFFFVIFVILPITYSLLDGSRAGNVALIPIEGPITGNGGKYLGTSTISSEDIVRFIEEAVQNEKIKVILLEINSPGGSAVASDEIANAVKKSKKPVVSLIREVGASGGYWVASASEQIIANRMSITGSIGVISSYIEFSGLMEKYGVGYQRLVAGERKDIGTPFRQLDNEEKAILQKKLDRIHDFFVEEIAENRNMDKSKVKKLATGEFYLGVEALQMGLIDQLGDKDTAEQYIKDTYQLKKIDFLVYEREAGLFDLLSGVFADFSFSMGEGLGSVFMKRDVIFV